MKIVSYFRRTKQSAIQYICRNSMVYVDKTELIEMLNKRLSTEDKCIAVSHARRFGKSHAAGMIDAYYSLGCDSTKLFEDTKLSLNADFKKYMNEYICELPNFLDSNKKSGSSHIL